MGLRNQKMIYGDAETAIKVYEETLSDNSKVYNVVIPKTEYAAKDEKDAYRVFEIIRTLLRP